MAERGHTYCDTVWACQRKPCFQGMQFFLFALLVCLKLEPDK
jgi:hypothetical protein